MLKKIINFIKYHNAVSIAISLVLVLSFSAMAASDDIKNAVLGEKIVAEQGVDNSALLATDLENFDLAMEIIAVSQDPEPSPLANGENAAGEQNYYITYTFKTLGIEDNRWQKIAREKILTVSKNALGSEDLGIYATEEIGEVADNEINYLKEVQTAERAKGKTKVVQTTDYTGLIGLVLDTKTKELSGYEPVVKPPVPEPSSTPPGQSENGHDDFTGAPEKNDNPTGNFFLQWLIENCLSQNRYWYNNTCNAEAEAVEPDLVCDSNHLDLCSTQELCEGIGLYWYDSACNLEVETPLTPPDQEGNPTSAPAPTPEPTPPPEPEPTPSPAPEP